MAVEPVTGAEIQALLPMGTALVASFLLMRAFYEGLATKGPAEALRAAQRSLLVDDPHPFAWAAYGPTGSPR